MKHTLATIISNVFEPFVLLPVAFVLSAYSVSVPVIRSLEILGIMVVPMLVFRLWAMWKHGLDWDIRDRERRIKPFIGLFVWLSLVTVWIRFFEPGLLGIFVLFLVWIIGFGMITAAWTKISGHVGGDMLAVGMVIAHWGWDWWPFLIIIPLVAWSRVVRRDHTIGQVVLGALYSAGIVAILQLR